MYDFLHRFHRPPEFFGVHERILLAIRVLKDRTSHLFAAHEGWLYPPSDAQLVAYWQRDLQVLDSMQPKDRALWKPLHRPWEPSRVPVISNEKRAKLRAHAKRMTTRE